MTLFYKSCAGTCAVYFLSSFLAVSIDIEITKAGMYSQVHSWVLLKAWCYICHSHFSVIDLSTGYIPQKIIQVLQILIHLAILCKYHLFLLYCYSSIYSKTSYIKKWEYPLIALEWKINFSAEVLFSSVLFLQLDHLWLFKCSWNLHCKWKTHKQHPWCFW